LTKNDEVDKDSDDSDDEKVFSFLVYISLLKIFLFKENTSTAIGCIKSW
jgi:hypothetical protein